VTVGKVHSTAFLTQKVGDFWNRLLGPGGSHREAEDTNRCRTCLVQLLAKLPHGCSQHLSMNLRVDGIHMVEVSWREYDSLLVQDFGRWNSGTLGKEKNGIGQSRTHDVYQERAPIPPSESGAAKIHEVDFDSFLDDILRQAFQKRFLGLQLMEGGVDQIYAKDADRFLLGNIGKIQHVNVQQDVVGLALGLHGICSIG
jgi:hypothetical protein